jgi:hypothetical protein
MEDVEGRAKVLGEVSDVTVANAKVTVVDLSAQWEEAQLGCGRSHRGIW